MNYYPRDKYPYRFYPSANLLFGRNYSSRLNCNDHIPWLKAPFSSSIYISGSLLIIPAFRIEKNRLIYIFPEELHIDLKELEAGIYRVAAVHNFKTEDHNPRLIECLAGIFLSRRVGEWWEEAESSFHECRTIEILGYLDTEKGGVYDIEL